jgi:AraC-like DNA-binding protein
MDTIGASLGFRDPSYFIRSFKRTHTLTPLPGAAPTAPRLTAAATHRASRPLADIDNPAWGMARGQERFGGGVVC